jgi:tetratricopeptide (TPR) repeat protein
MQIGSLRSLQHNTDEASRYIQQALPFFQQGGYRKLLSMALTLLGRAYRDKGDYAAALKTFEEQFQVAEQVDDPSQVALSHFEMGNVLSNQEQYPKALHHFEESYRIYKTLDAEMYVGYAANNRASVLWQMGRYEDARKALVEASSIAKRPGATYKPLLAEIYMLSGLLELSDLRLRESEVKSRQALDLAGTQYIDVAIQAKYGLGLAEARSGRSRTGALLCEDAVKMAARTGDPQLLSGALLASAEAMLEGGEAERALATALRALESFARYGKRESEWRAWLIAGRASNRLGKESEARNYASNAYDRLSSLEQQWGAESFSSYVTRRDIQQSRKQLDRLPKP